MRQGLSIGATVAVLGWLAAVSSSIAVSPPVPPATNSPAPPSEDAVKTAFDGLPEADRRAVQDALVWTGDSVGIINGAYGPRTRDGLAAFAKKNDLSPGAVLEPRGRARLLTAAKAARDAVGFAPVHDKKAGVALSLPMKLLSRQTATESGTHYASADGGVVVDTLSRPMGEGGLAELFDRLSGSAGERKVTYKLLKPDFFVVSGEIGERKFYSRFAAGMFDGTALARGFTLAYPKTDAGRLDPVALATAASFAAFPAPANTAATPPLRNETSTPAPIQRSAPAIRIAPGVALARLSNATCASPSVGGLPSPFRAEDPDTGLALLDLPARTPERPDLADNPVPQGASMFALFTQGSDTLFITPATARVAADATAGTFIVSASLQGPMEGLPVVDREGRLAGLTASPRRPASAMAGTTLETDYPVVDTTRIRAFLDKAGVPGDGMKSAEPKSAAEVAALWHPLMLTVTCQTAAPRL